MYDDTFYAVSRDGMISSAQALVPILMKELGLAPESKVIDVGCGEGWWAAAFANHGFDVIGIDGGWHGEHLLGDRFIPHDLATTLPSHLVGQFDVVVCLEVAEHLPPRRAQSFVAELCSLATVRFNPAPLVIFSAAIPGQGGTGHLNEQWPDYWTKLFNENGLAVDGSLRLDIWADDRIENWYRQNLLVAGRGWSQGPMPLSLVHPVLYDARRH